MSLLVCNSLRLSPTPKTKLSRTNGLLLMAVLFASLSPLALATTYVVSATSPACKSGFQYTTIGAAVAAVPAGATIYVCPGIYPEQVLITKKLTLTGVSGNGATGNSAAGANNPVIAVPAGGLLVNSNDLYQYPNGEPTAAQILVQTPSNSLTNPISVNINNITVDGTGNNIQTCGTDLVGIYYQNANGTLDHVVTRFQELPSGYFGCQSGLAIYVQSGYGSGGSADVTTEYSSVHDYDKNGITYDGSATTGTIQDNYVVGIGATPLTAQNGIQVSVGAFVKVSSNVVTDDVYINPSNCTSDGSNGTPLCYSASGILIYDAGGTGASNKMSIASNTVSNTQGAIVTYGDVNGVADYNSITSNKVTTSPSAGVFSIDGIDLCSNYNTASNNTVYNSSGSGIHIDSQCTEMNGGSGNGTTVSNNTINEACAGVLLGSGTGSVATTNPTYNVIQATISGDSCPVGTSVARKGVHLRPHPRH